MPTSEADSDSGGEAGESSAGSPRLRIAGEIDALTIEPRPTRPLMPLPVRAPAHRAVE